VEIDSDGVICDMRDTLGVAGTMRCQFTGIYIAHHSLLAHIPSKKIESIVDTFIRIIKEGKGGLQGVVIDEGIWNDIGKIETYHRICSEFEQR
ncbi:MAG: hypothetical protein WCJ49_03600, partial [Deltaproteobacteria bacterium]